MQDTKTDFLNTTSLWFGMLGPPVVWLVHFYGVWIIDEVGCELGLATTEILNVSVLQIVILMFSLIALGIVAFAGYTAYRNYRRFNGISADEQARHARAIERSRYMTVVGMGFSALFSLVILYVTIPLFVLPVCNL